MARFDTPEEPPVTDTVTNDNQQSNGSDNSIQNKILESQLQKQDEHWVRAYWRPAMGWLYMVICIFDFIIFPLFAMIQPLIMKSFGIASPSYKEWVSLTLSNGGIMHLAFGAILGVAAWTRGQEKLAKVGQ